MGDSHPLGTGIEFKLPLCVPNAVQFNYKESDVTAVNNSFAPSANLKVKAEVRKLDWGLAWSAEAPLKSLPAETSTTGLIKVPAAADLNISGAHFVRCQLLNQQNEILDDTFYWRTSDSASFGSEGGFSELNQMPGSSLSVSTHTINKDGKSIIKVSLENTSGQLAFFIRITILDADK